MAAEIEENLRRMRSYWRNYIARVLPVLVLLVVAMPAAAHADGTAAVLVSGDPGFKDAVTKEVGQWMREKGYTVSDTAIAVQAPKLMTDCFVTADLGCGQSVYSKHVNADAFLFMMVEVQPNPKDGSRDVTITGWFFQKGRAVAVDRRYCQHCRETTMKLAAGDLAAVLSERGVDNVGRLRITSDPSVARVMVDGQPVGATPMEYQLPTGTHRIVVDKEGFVLEDRSVEVVANDVTSVRVPLKRKGAGPGPASSDEGPEGQSRGSRGLLPYSLLGGGAAAMVAGGVLIAMHQDETSTEKYYRNSRPAGLVLVGVGAVTAGVGAYLWVKAGRSSQAAPVVAISNQHAMVGWATAF